MPANLLIYAIRLMSYPASSNRDSGLLSTHDYESSIR